jgi:IS30 family transposase
MPTHPLCAVEREKIRAGIERDETDREIGDRLGRHRCTISAEINRKGGRTGYSATAAQAALSSSGGVPRWPSWPPTRSWRRWCPAASKRRTRP